jgi:hypothetical protein
LPPTANAGDELVIRDGNAIYLRSDIVAAHYPAFLAVADDGVKTVYLYSGGGEMYPAIAIGRLIRAKGYGTMLLGGRICSSACALIWAAGRPRWFDPYAFFGLHCARLRGAEKCSESGTAQMREYLQEMEMPPSIMVTIDRMEITWIDRDTEGLIIAGRAK